MVIVFEKKASEEEIKEITKMYEDYTKIVVDIEKGILSAGGESFQTKLQSLFL